MASRASTERTTSPRRAAEILRAGGLVAFPTETVFGLGVDATDAAAVNRLFAAKGRPGDNPLIVHLPDIDSWPQAAASLTPDGEALLRAFAPGPLTVVLPKAAAISPLVTAGLETVGVRVPAHPIAVAILRLAGVPVAAPSANRSGRPSGTTWRSVLEDLDGRIDAVVSHDTDAIGLESTVVDCAAAPATVLRSGAITLEQIQSVLPAARAAGAAPVHESPAQPKSPGLAHPHYQPQATVRLVNGSDELPADPPGRCAYCGLRPATDPPSFAVHRVHESVEQYAAAFYEFLREADRCGVAVVYVQRAPASGLGAALRDRQRRAAGLVE